MNLFNIDYLNNNIQGFAVVEATNANRAANLLQQKGLLNATRYKCTTIIEVGCNDSLEERIVSEVYAGKLQSTVNNEVIKDTFEDIKKLFPKADFSDYSEKELQNLRNRIDFTDRKLIVDHIGAVTRPKPNDGYLVFRTKYHKGKNDAGIDQLTEHDHLQVLYIRHNKQYVCLGTAKFKTIQDAVKKITLYRFMGRDISSNNYLLEDIRPRIYGIFYLKKKNSRKVRSRKVNFTYLRLIRSKRWALVYNNENKKEISYSIDALKKEILKAINVGSIRQSTYLKNTMFVQLTPYFNIRQVNNKKMSTSRYILAIGEIDKKHRMVKDPIVTYQIYSKKRIDM